MTDVFPRLKADPEPCQCGCGLVGQPRVKMWKDGTRHVKFCKCRRCCGGRRGSRVHRVVGRQAASGRHPV
jgi:hypothetical protein